MADKTLFPTGKSKVEIAWVECGTSSQKGTPSVNFKLSNGEQAIIHRCYTTEKAMWQIENMAKAAGVQKLAAVKAAKEANDSGLLALFKGKQVEVEVVVDEYENKDGAIAEGREVKSVAMSNPTKDGEHLASIEAVDFSKSRAKGTVSMDLLLRSSDGSGVWVPRWVTDKSIWQLEDVAICVGVDPAKIVEAAKKQNIVGVHPLLGKKIKIVLKSEDVELADGRKVVNQNLVAIDSMDKGIREYMRARRDARIQGNKFIKPPPAPSVDLSSDEIPF